MAKKKIKFKKETKPYFLGVKLTERHQELLLKRQRESGDESMAQTVRKILIRDLEGVCQN